MHTPKHELFPPAPRARTLKLISTSRRLEVHSGISMQTSIQASDSAFLIPTSNSATTQIDKGGDLQALCFFTAFFADKERGSFPYFVPHFVFLKTYL